MLNGGFVVGVGVWCKGAEKGGLLLGQVAVDRECTQVEEALERNLDCRRELDLT